MIIRSKVKGDKYFLTHGEDMTPVLEENKFIRENSTTNGWTDDRDMKHIGEIPALFYYKYAKEHPELLNGDRQQRERILRKIFREHPEFRTSSGRF